LVDSKLVQMVLITPTIEENGVLKISFPEESGIAPVSVPIRPAEDVLKKWKVCVFTFDFMFNCTQR
jgi:hypothetical protein